MVLCLFASRWLSGHQQHTNNALADLDGRCVDAAQGYTSHRSDSLRARSCFVADACTPCCHSSLCAATVFVHAYMRRDWLLCLAAASGHLSCVACLLACLLCEQRLPRLQLLRPPAACRPGGVQAGRGRQELCRMLGWQAATCAAEMRTNLMPCCAGEHANTSRAWWFLGCVGCSWPVLCCQQSWLLAPRGRLCVFACARACVFGLWPARATHAYAFSHVAAHELRQSAPLRGAAASPAEGVAELDARAALMVLSPYACRAPVSIAATTRYTRGGHCAVQRAANIVRLS
jgi:hypothetical protein